MRAAWSRHSDACGDLVLSHMVSESQTMSAARPWDSSLWNHNKGSWWPNGIRLWWHAAATNIALRAGILQLNAAAVVIHSSRLVNRPCVASSRASAPHFDRPADQQRGAWPSPEQPRPSERRERKRTRGKEQRRGAAYAHKITVVHKAAILNPLTVNQEAYERDSKCDTVHFVRPSANGGAMCRIKNDHRCVGPTWSDIKVALSSQRGSRLIIWSWADFAAAPENGFFQPRQRTAHFGSRGIILSPCSRGTGGIHGGSAGPCSLSTLAFVPSGSRRAFTCFIPYSFVWLIEWNKLHRLPRPPLTEPECKWLALHFSEACRPQVSGRALGWPTMMRDVIRNAGF